MQIARAQGQLRMRIPQLNGRLSLHNERGQQCKLSSLLIVA